jgi:hypothetical protein
MNPDSLAERLFAAMGVRTASNPLAPARITSVADTVEPKKAYIAALLRERAGYEQRGLTDRVADVDAELARHGHEEDR